MQSSSVRTYSRFGFPTLFENLAFASLFLLLLFLHVACHRTRLHHQSSSLIPSSFLLTVAVLAQSGLLSIPAPMPPQQEARIDARQLEREYGDILRAVPFSDKTTPRQILRQWERTYPDVFVAEGVFRTWFGKHRAAADLEAIHGYATLEARAGDKLRQFQGEGLHGSFKLVRELRSQVGLNTTDAVMREWMRHHGGGAPSRCLSAQDLEQRVGQRLREHLAQETGAGDADNKAVAR